MTRINTNVSSLQAQNSLANSQSQLETALTRLSTGLQINSGADNPAGLIESQNLGAEITADNAAISNSNQANDLISTADSALSQVGTLLNTIRGLVSDAANTGALSSSQIAADQLQVDSSLQAIDQISQTTEFQGSVLLDGSLNFQTTSAGTIGTKATGTFGAVATNTKASTTLDGVTLTAKTTGTSLNNVTIKVTGGAASAGAVAATYSSSSHTITVKIVSGSTTQSSVAAAINAISSRTFSATVPGSGTAASASESLAGGAATAKASATLDGVTIAAKTGGTALNTATVLITGGAASAGAVAATYTTSSNTITVTIVSGSTTRASVTAAINAVASRTFTATGTGSSVVAAGTITLSGGSAGAKATTTVDTVVVSAKSAGTALNTATVKITGGAASAGAVTATYTTSSNTITVTVVSGSTTESSVAAAINAISTRSFTATTPGSGVAASGSSTLSGGTASNEFSVTAKNAGAQYNGVTVKITSGAASAAGGTASYSTSTNTITVTSKTGTTAADVAASINSSLGTLFTASSVSGGGGDVAVGTLSATTSGGALNDSITGLQVNQANFGTGTSIGVNVDVQKQATQAKLTYSGGNLSSATTLQIGGSQGYQVFDFGSGATVSQIEGAINNASNATGVTATVNNGNLVLQSQDYGSSQFVSATALSGTFGTVDSTGASVSRATGTDIQASINGVQATGAGLQVSLDTSNLNLSFDVNSSYTDNSSLSFNITGGGATFQLGPNVTSSQQVTLGIPGVSTATLGGTDGTLYELASGGAADLSTDPSLAASIVNEVITQVTSLQGRLGAFQSTTLQTNISSLTDAVSNLTSAQSSIQDADYAAETAALTRAQVLVQAGTSVLSIANQQPQQVLSLLKAAGG